MPQANVQMNFDERNSPLYKGTYKQMRNKFSSNQKIKLKKWNNF